MTTDNQPSITIKGEEIKVQIVHMEVNKLKFFTDNPRVYTVVHAGGNDPSQEEIETKLRRIEHVKQLVQDIKSNNGLIDPLIVRDGTYEVLEGNSRLAAYRSLITQDPIHWGKAKCWVLPETITETQIYAILGQYHLKGKKDWAPYEQAGFLYRRHVNQNVSVEQLSEDVGIGIRATRQLIETYKFMLDHGEDNINRWSYYEEYLKSSYIKKARKQYPKLDETVVNKVQTGEIKKAVDIRDKLKDVTKAAQKNKRIIKKFVDNKITLDEALRQTDRKGLTSTSYQKLNRFRLWLISEDAKADIKQGAGAGHEKIQYEIKKLIDILEKYHKH